nr:S4 domain-containing protein [Pseudomonadota bacterium]
MPTAPSDNQFMGVRTLAIGPERDGQRVDNALATLLKGVPRSLVYRLLRTGQVRINGKRAKPDTRLVEGDQLRIPPVRVAERQDHT